RSPRGGGGDGGDPPLHGDARRREAELGGDHERDARRVPGGRAHADGVPGADQTPGPPFTRGHGADGDGGSARLTEKEKKGEGKREKGSTPLTSSPFSLLPSPFSLLPFPFHTLSTIAAI